VSALQYALPHCRTEHATFEHCWLDHLQAGKLHWSVQLAMKLNEQIFPWKMAGFVAGASGGIGQPLSLLLKMNERVDVLSLYDVVGTPGVGADVGHIDSIAKVGLDRGVPWTAAEQANLPQTDGAW
jgi:lactate/malate dehydrogenase, NAD binding domain